MSKRKGDPGYPAGWCIHYRSSHGGETFTDCEAGIPFAVWNAVKFDTRPCFLGEDGESKPGAATCALIRKPTAEEIAAHEEWVRGRMGQLGIVMQGISEWRKAHKGKSAREVVECPACKGRLRLSIAAYNGHVHGHCETDGCVSWME